MHSVLFSDTFPSLSRLGVRSSFRLVSVFSCSLQFLPEGCSHEGFNWALSLPAHVFWKGLTLDPGALVINRATKLGQTPCYGSEVDYVKPEAVSNSSQELDMGVSRNEGQHREYLAAKF